MRISKYFKKRSYRLACIHWNISLFMNKLISTSSRPSVAATSHFTPAIQQVLNGKVDSFLQMKALAGRRWLVVRMSVRLGCLINRNINSIRQATERRMRPTGTAILWNVLVERMRQVRLSIHVAPRKLPGKNALVKIGVRQRTDHTTEHRVSR